MAKISKVEIYPFDLDIDPEDYLIGTDKNNDKKTKSYKIGDLGVAMGRAGVRVQEIYLGFCPFPTSQVSLADQINTFLGLHSIEVDFNTLVIFKIIHHNTVLQPGSIDVINTIQSNYYFPKGFGTYDPISSAISFTDLIIDYEKESFLNSETITTSPDANVIDLGDLTNDVSEQLLYEYLNTNGNNYDLSSSNYTYYFRFTQNDIEYLYVFNANQSTNGYGIYGQGELQFSDNELIFIFSSNLNYSGSSSRSYSVPFNKYTIYKDENNNNPENIDLIESNDVIAGRWSGSDYDDGNGTAITSGKYLIAKYIGGLTNIFSNYELIFIQP